MSRTAHLLAAALVTGLLPGGAPAAGDDPLRALRWQHRVLLMFAPGAADARAADFERMVAARACDLDDRDVVVGRVYATGPSRLGDAALGAGAAADIRREHAVAEDAFSVVLLGKDGGAKLRESAVPDPDSVFALIDAMPMRIDEMRARRSTCPG